MASVSSSHLILFIASLLIAASVAGTFTQGVQRLSSALGDRSLDVAKDVRTDIEIISDPGSVDAIYDDSGEGSLTVLVKNTGSLNLDADSGQIDVLVDGRLQTDVTVEVADGDTWMVGNVARLTITKSLEPGDHRVTVIVNGDEETLRFRIQ
ncbi:flagellar protein G [Halorussus rarus]|uniref:flagellar protein G n=1 Tax=Halorussus TaxID=1070314 RepID=UPI000E218506|nr:flagellar protein G [Halorussus rarus]NHN59170.1 flagellar protein G [Halorussus sp. JP-T4]